MSCCSSSSNKLSSSKTAKRHSCPKSSTECLQVPTPTVLLHVKKPWKADLDSLNERTYYFCSDPDCEVVYFTSDNSVINKSDLRTLVGIKEVDNGSALACYCFDITLAEAKSDNKLKQFVVDKTKNNFCACESQNPSGRCCLKDFPR